MVNVRTNTVLSFIQASSLIGSPMTYTLFEYAKENQDELVVKEPEEEQEEEARESVGATGEGAAISSSKSKPKIHLSKAAKRRQADKLSERREREGGEGWTGFPTGFWHSAQLLVSKLLQNLVKDPVL